MLVIVLMGFLSEQAFGDNGYATDNDNNSNSWLNNIK